MAGTLRRIGISEDQFIAECDASFKQGSKFINWSRGEGESYYHPFSLPTGYHDLNVVDHWLDHNDKMPFDAFSTPQAAVCNKHLAPKQANTPEYANVVNYGYHLNAGKFADLLKKHATHRLGVEHISDDVVSVESTEDGLIQLVKTKEHGPISGDLFIDCTGFKSLLLGDHLGVPFKSYKHILFNDRAMAFQVPHESTTSDINSTTHATAHKNGWIWDIALPTRRGIGIVYSSKYGTEEQALETVEAYFKDHTPHISVADLTPNKITIDPGHRQTFWKGNCLAIGLSSGFIDPLEATAMVLIEFSARFLTDHLPAKSSDLPVIARKYNQRLNTHWRNIIDFIKLHYVLTNRTDSDYWVNHKRPDTIPQSLAESLSIWQQRSPWHADVEVAQSMFPPASYQYILYGMGFDSENGLPGRRSAQQERDFFNKLREKTLADQQQMLHHLPSNRQLLNTIKQRWESRNH
jgi:hypothetical protein